MCEVNDDIDRTQDDGTEDDTDDITHIDKQIILDEVDEGLMCVFEVIHYMIDW